MYTDDAGYSPPSACCAPVVVRMSTSGWAFPVSSSALIVGSVVIPHWIDLWSIAAMNVGPALTATGVILLAGTPFLTARYWVRKLVDDPSPVTPSRLPLQSAGDLIDPATSLRQSSTS